MYYTRLLLLNPEVESFRPTGVDNVISNAAAGCASVGADCSNVVNVSDSLFQFKARKGLGVVHINARSVLQKIDFLKIWITNSDPDVAVISESWLNPNIKDSDIAIVGYNVFRTDRAKRGGGVAMFVKNNLNCSVRISTSLPGQFELLAVNINLGDYPIVIVGVYRPPSAVPEALQSLSENFSSVSSCETVILGDFNLDWFSPVANEFQDLCLESNLTQLVTESTRPNMKIPSNSSLLDLILTNRPQHYLHTCVFPLDFSDHCPVGCIRDGRRKGAAPLIVYKRSLKNLDDQAFLFDLLSSNPTSIELIPDVGVALSHFLSVFHAVTDKHAPFKKCRIKNRFNPWFTHDISEATTNRNKAWALARSTGSAAAWQSFRHLRNKCTHLVKMAKSKYFVNHLSACGSNPTKFWKTVKSLKGVSPPTLPQQIMLEDKAINDPKEVCNAFNNHFIQCGTLFDLSNFPDVPDGVLDNFTVDARSLGTDPTTSFSFRPIQQHEVLSALRNSKCMKSSVGADQLDPRLLKLAAPIIARPLTHIFNLSLFSGYIPSIWKSALVVPLHKGGDPNEMNNYRPISKLPCLAKMLESFVNEQISSFLSLNSILCPFQSGFRAGHSTITATTLVVNDIASAVDKKQCCAALFIDLSKAFDTVNHEILFGKLNSLGFDNVSLRWFKNYFTGRTQCIDVAGLTSEALVINSGVPQGSILGPVLFSLYINNICDHLEHCKVHFYADDTILYASAPSIDQAVSNLQHAFDCVQDSLKSLKLMLNESKTKFMIFSNGRNNVPSTHRICTRSGTNIEQVPCYKYLGIWLDDRLSFKSHVLDLAKKVKIKLGALYRIRSCFTFENRMEIVQSTILSVLDYGDIVYMYAAPSTLKLLDSVYHSAIRFVTGDAFRTHHCNLYKNVGWSPLADRREKHCLLFVYKALVGKLPNYLMSLLKLKSICHNTRSQSLISLEIPLTKTNIGKIAFKFFASHKWNTIQVELKLTKYLSVNQFKSLLDAKDVPQCCCFK